MPVYQLLTDRTLAQASAITPTTLIHIVYTGDPSQNIAGSSYKAELQQLSSIFSGGTDTLVTGGTYSAGTITFTNSSGGTFPVTGLTDGSYYLPLSGGTVTGDTVFTQGLTATTISATTYLNLPVTADTNFANTNLTLNNDRIHDLNGYDLFFSEDGAGFGYISFGIFGGLGTGSFVVNGSTDSTLTITNSYIKLRQLDNEFWVNSTETVVNETGYPNNFRVETDNNENMFFVDGTNNKVGISTNTPSETLDVSGKTKTINFQMTSGATNGYVLTSDANGNASWQVPTGSGTFTGGTVSGATNFTNGLTANTMSASTLFVNGVQITGDTFVTGGTYSTGTILFTNNQNGQFSVTGITSSGTTFTGGSGNCIADLYVTNIHGCSPITIYDPIKSTGSTVSGQTSFSFGFETSATTDYSFAIGSGTMAANQAANVEGLYSVASGVASHAEGILTIAAENGSHAEGGFSNGIGLQRGGYALSWGSHAEGSYTTASGITSHVEGFFSRTFGFGSHAEGGYSDGFTNYSGGTAIGDGSHAEGIKTVAYGNFSHAEGNETYAFGTGSHTEGNGTYTSGSYQHATGKWNLTADTTSGAFIIGNGTDSSNRSNLLFAGNSGVTIYGDLTATTISATTYLNLPVTGLTAGNNISITGNNANFTIEATGIDGIFGISNNIGKFTYYSNLQDAINNANSGDTIQMFANVVQTSATTVTLKDGVNLNMNGYTYELRNSSTNNTITDNNVAVNCKIYNGTISRSGSTYVNDTTSLCLYIQNSGTTIETNGVYFNSSDTSAINNVGTIRGAIVKAKRRGITNSGKLYSVNVTSTLDIAILSFQPPSEIYDSVASGESGIYLSMVSSGGVLRNSVGYGNGGIGVFVSSASTVQSCVGYSTANVGFYALNSNVYDCKGYSSTLTGLYLQNSRFSSDVLGYSFTNIGLQILNNSGAISGYSQNVIGESLGGVGTYIGATASGSLLVVKNLQASSHYSNSAGYACEISSNNISILGGSLSVIGNAQCLYSNSPFTLKYANLVLRTTASPAISTNITQGITNSADTQGNIII